LTVALRRLALAAAALSALAGCGGSQPASAELSTGTAATLRPAWQANLGGAVDGRPAIIGNLVVAGSDNGTLAAYRLADGHPVWSRQGLGPLLGSPLVAGDQVFVGSLASRVYALALQDGRINWSWRGPTASAAIWSSPMPWRGLLLVGVASQAGDQPLEAGRLVALDQVTGREIWSYCTQPGCAPGGGIWSSAAVDPAGRAFIGVGNPDDALLAVDATSGRRLWETSFHPDGGQDLDVGATPVIVAVGGREGVAAGSTAGDFKLLDAATGAEIWSQRLDAGSAVHGLIGSPASDGRRLYVPSASPPLGLIALGLDGRVAWTAGTRQPVYGRPALGGGVAVFATGEVFGDQSSGEVMAVASADGRVLWRRPEPAALLGSPALAGGEVVIGDTAGTLLAFRPRS
jgi:outer membrane protein assembly factor BamB